MSASHELENLARDSSFGFIDRATSAPRRFHPQLIANAPENTMLRALRHELRNSNSFAFSVAFVSSRAIALLMQELVDFEGTGQIVTSDYLGFNSPRAFADLLKLTRLPKSTINVRIHNSGAFHPKGYVFQRAEGFTAILGSSNLTASALASNYEWNLRVSGTRDSDLHAQLSNLLDAELLDSVPLTEEWIRGYAATYTPPARVPRTPMSPVVVGDDSGPAAIILPNAMQEEALARIEEVRASGSDRALVISATGTGKTILAALAVRAASPARMLFIVHREQILDRAIAEFSRVLGAPRSDFGKLAGSHRELDRRYVFATVQTLSRPEVLAQCDPAAFDYVLIDEVHRAGAASYERVLAHFAPAFLLGMTATPERMDGVNIFELFNYTVPYEIRLGRALEEDMLAPFHYYGLSDVTFDDGTTTENGTALSRLVASDRVDYLLWAIDTYTQAGQNPRGLIFCSRTDEARALAAELNRRSLRGRALRTAALTGEDSVSSREEAARRLETGELDYILTVDVFNEGVDIPSVNQVVMLRQTQSSIVFVQQLGRGLRKADDKDFVVVLDFIGNYSTNYLIPTALFGDDSLNKESLRKNLIAAEESGVLPGLSSVRFDRIAHDRVLKSIETAQLDSLRNLRSAVELVSNRLGRVPDLIDFLQFESADPVILATKLGNYRELLARLGVAPLGLSPYGSSALSLVTREYLPAKRPHELLILKELLHRGTLSALEIGHALARAGIEPTPSTVESVKRALTLEFNTEAEKRSLGVDGPAVVTDSGALSLQPTLAREFGDSDDFRAAIADVVETGLAVMDRRYDVGRPFTPGAQYSRKDASRLLNWSTNMYSTIYGYKVDAATGTCPIFVTLHKGDHISASTAYADELLDTRTMRWATRSRRTLASGELRPIVGNEVALHVFVKKSDADASEFYYLGRAHSSNAVETTMPDANGNPLPVVHMDLTFDEPIPGALFDYFHTDLTD